MRVLIDTNVEEDIEDLLTEKNKNDDRDIKESIEVGDIREKPY